MAQYDISENADGPGLLLTVQSDLLDALNTAAVVPLLPKDSAPAPAARLNPVFDIDGQPYVMVTQFLAAVPTKLLKSPRGTLKAHNAAITAALDMLFHGF